MIRYRLFTYAGFFVLVECCDQLRFIRVVADAFKHAIEGPAAQDRTPASQLAAGVSLFFWLAVVLSTVIDNAPLAMILIRVVTTMVDNGLAVNMKALAWAVSFGCTLGGNATLYGSASNALAGSLASSKGYQIGSKQFTRVAFPIVFTSIVAAYVYILIAYSGAKYYN